MSEEIAPQDQNKRDDLDLRFGEEVEIDESGFSFRPIIGFELEIDGSVYMYSEDGNLEISLMGGKLEEGTSIAELNDDLVADFMDNFDEYNLTESGTDTIQGITGYLNTVRFLNAEEEGRGRALICSPSANQYFFLLMIASADYWQAYGKQLFTTLKAEVHFHPQFTSELEEIEQVEHPDLTIGTYEEISPEDDFILRIEKGDVSLLLAARTYVANETITINEIHAPGGKQLYVYHPEGGKFTSLVSDEPLVSTYGEVCFFFPRDNQLALQPGDYRFRFSTESGMPLQEIQVIIRVGRALDIQTVDLNFWLATEDERFDDPESTDQFKSEIRKALNQRLSPLNLILGEITCFHPAPDELSAFTSVNINTDLADCSYMITETIHQGRALNIGLVDHFINSDPPSPVEVQSISSGHPGMILSTASPHACILMNWSVLNGDLNQLSGAIIDQLVAFSGIDIKDTQQREGQHLILNREIAWRLRRHPIFYEAD